MMKAVLFDRDGVILDSESTNVNSAVAAFKRLNIDILESEYGWIAGKHPDEYSKIFQDKYTFNFEEFRTYQKEIYYKLLEITPLFGETISLIHSLYKESIPLALTTAAGIEGTRKVLEYAGLQDVFECVVTSEDCKNRKPDPEAYLLTAEKLGVDPSECVVIEDSLVGVTAAKAAGMVCIAMPGTYTKHSDFSIADKVVNSASEIDLVLLNSFF